MLHQNTPISIGIPFFNAEKYLIDAIRSIFCQTHNNWELILLDDGSTDNSLKLAKSINDKRIRVFSDGLRKGLSYRLNDITMLSNYSFIARMDADDLLAPNKFEKQVKILIDDPNIDLISTNSYSIDKYDTLLGKGFKSYNDFSKDELLHKKRHGIVHPSIMGRKEWFLRNPYNNNITIGQDYDLWIRAAEKKDFKILILDEPLFYYREEMNITLKKLMGAYETKYRVLKKHSDKNNFYFFIKFKLKVIIIRLLDKLNFLKLLLKRRTKRLNKNEKKLFNENLKIIKTTKLPGLDF
jgi:glycosyltransferase involved in cell wall biosynthesis